MLKKEIDRKMLAVPEKHKTHKTLININNMKNEERIGQVKSTLKFNKEESCKLLKSLKSKDKLRTQEDYYKLY